MSAEELGRYRKSNNWSGVQGTYRLLATLNARDQRIAELEQGVKSCSVHDAEAVRSLVAAEADISAMLPRIARLERIEGAAQRACKLLGFADPDKEHEAWSTLRDALKKDGE